MRRAVFLDRDGVINRAIVRQGKPYPPSGLSELEILPGVVEACQSLRAAGFLLVVVTNQPDVARGTQRRDVVEMINERIRAEVQIDDIRVCYHDDPDECLCRKPSPGLLLDSAREGRIDLGVSFMVGDRWKDVEAGRRAGCKTILIDHRYPERLSLTPDYRASSLAAAAEWILRQPRYGDSETEG